MVNASVVYWLDFWLVDIDYLYYIRLFDIWGYMKIYKAYLFCLGMFYYMFMNHVIRLIWRCLLILMACAAVLYLSLYLSAVLVAIAITSTISFEAILLIMLLLGILSLCGLFYSLRR